MRRFIVNASLAGAAILLAMGGIVSYFTTVMVPTKLTPRNVVLVHLYEGRIRLFWIQGTRDPIQVFLMGDGPGLRIEPVHEFAALPASLAGVDIPRREWFRTITIGGIRQVASFGGAWRTPMTARNRRLPVPAYSTFIRLPIWLPCLIFLYGPCRWIAGSARERYRQRHNLCTTCGYRLYALTLPRCPECGSATLPDDRASPLGNL